MSKPTCAAMALYDKHKQYLSAINRRISYLEERKNTMGIYNGYSEKEMAALKYCRDLLHKGILEDAKAVLEMSEDDREKEVCRRHLDKWK